MRRTILQRNGIALALVLALCLSLCTVAHATSLNVYCEPASAVAGENVTFNIVVNNTSNYSMQSLSYSSDYTGFAFSGPNSIAAGETGVYSGAITMTDVMLDVPITFTLHWEYYDANGSSLGTDNLSASVTVPRGSGAANPALPGGTGGAGVSAARTVSTKKASNGEQVTFTYTVTNNSADELTALSITDKELNKEPLVKDITVAAGAVYTFEYVYTMGSKTVNSAPVVDYKAAGASASVTVEEVAVGMVNTKLSVEVVQDAPTADGVLFNLNVVNNGNQKINKIKIKDEKGNSINSELFALSVGESRALSYQVPNAEERNVVFYITGSSATGDAYEDNTSTYTVRRYIDPSLVGLEFSAEVLETLNAQGSIKIRFLIKNTGSIPLQNLVLSENEIGEIKRQESVPVGETVLEETVNVGAPRDMAFSINVQDEAKNEYTYTANLTAAYIGVESGQNNTTENVNAIDSIESIGMEIGNKVSDALTVALVVLAVLCLLSAAALITLTIMEKKRKEETARRKAYQAKRMRSQARAQAETEAGEYEQHEGMQQPNYYGNGYDAQQTYTIPRQSPGAYPRQNGGAYSQRASDPRTVQDPYATSNGDTQRFYPPRNDQ